MTALPLYAQLINLLAAILLLLAFAMLAQRRVHTLIDLFACQGLALGISTAIVAYATSQSHLYWSAGLTLLLKVALLPWLLNRLVRQLDGTIAPQISETLKEAQGAMKNAKEVLGQDAPLQSDLSATLLELSRAAKSVNALVDYLERHPEALLRGKLGESK